METIDVFYTGKKKQLHLKMPWLLREYHFRPNNVPVSMLIKDARRLIRENPVPFRTKMSKEDFSAFLSDKGVDGEDVLVSEKDQIPKIEEEEKPRTKYVSQMNKTELLQYANDEYGVELDVKKDKIALKNEIALLFEKKEGNIK
jgi:hypothetical protein